MTTRNVLITYTLSPVSTHIDIDRLAAPISAPVLKRAARVSAQLVLTQLGHGSCSGCQRFDCLECAVFGAPLRPSLFMWSAGQWKQTADPDEVGSSSVVSAAAPSRLFATIRSIPALPPPSDAAIALLLTAVLHLNLSLPSAKRAWQRLQATIMSALVDGVEISLDATIGHLTEEASQ